MRNLILQMLTMGGFGGAAALLTLAATALLRRLHTPSRWLCLLWGVAALRFVLPWGIPILVRQPQNAQLTKTLVAVQNAAQANPAFVPPAPGQNAAMASVPWYAGITVWDVLAAVWVLGSVILVLRAVFGCAKLHRQLALACITMDGCYTCSAVDAPFTFGVIKPRIYMPQSLQGAPRRAVLLHERTHISHGDLITKPLVYLVACLHWWNPLAWLTFYQMECTMEAACDEAAIRDADKKQRTQYCESILQFAQHRTMPGSLAFGQGKVKDRVRNVLRFRRPAAVMLALCAAIMLLAGTACMAQPTMAEASATAEPTAQPESSAAEPTAAFSFICPVEYTSISRLEGGGHRGDDLAAEKGTPVYAALAGTVTQAEYGDSLGNYVTIDHGTDGDGHHWETEYAHMDTLTVEVGQVVAQGEQLGTVGNTGKSTGDHLHFEMLCDGNLMEPSKIVGYA